MTEFESRVALNNAFPAMTLADAKAAARALPEPFTIRADPDCRGYLESFPLGQGTWATGAESPAEALFWATCRADDLSRNALAFSGHPTLFAMFRTIAAAFNRQMTQPGQMTVEKRNGGIVQLVVTLPNNGPAHSANYDLASFGSCYSGIIGIAGAMAAALENVFSDLESKAAERQASFKAENLTAMLAPLPSERPGIAPFESQDRLNARAARKMTDAAPRDPAPAEPAKGKPGFTAAFVALFAIAPVRPSAPLMPLSDDAMAAVMAMSRGHDLESWLMSGGF